MLINADFSQVVIVKPENYHWVKSPHGEVDRIMLDRIGDEVARATSLVKYAPNSTFPEHRHPQGEEILVLSGVFTEDANQHYPAGWYLRNPHNSKHQPSSEEGTLIFVKLMQIPIAEQDSVRVNTKDPAQWRIIGDRLVCPLFDSSYEHTYLEKISSNQDFKAVSNNGLEILIIDGHLYKYDEVYEVGTWIRLPHTEQMDFQSGSAGATLYIKSGHLGGSLPSIEVS